MPPDENPGAEIERLRARVAQLKRDLGHSRANGYIVTAVREAIDREMAGWEAQGDILPGCEPPEYALLQRLRAVAYGDHACDMFDKR